MLPSQSELFSGVLIDPNIATAIYQDISNLYHNFFFIPSRVTRGNAQFIQLRGHSSVPNPPESYLFPISIFLQIPGFPFIPPTVRVEAGPGVQLQRSYVLESDGTIILQELIRWTPMQTTLLHIGYALPQFLRRFPVVSPASLSFLKLNAQELIEKGVEEASKLVFDANESNHHRFLIENQTQRIRQFYATVIFRKKQLESAVALERQKFLQELENVATFSATQEMEIEARDQAKDAAVAGVVNELKQSFRDGAITVDELMKATREFTRNHFRRL